MTIQANRSLVIGDRAIYSNLLINANISVIGYRDLSSSGNKLFRPQEIILGNRGKNEDYLMHLAWDPKADIYTPAFYTPAPAAVCDILPVTGDFDYEWPRKLVTSCALVVAASPRDCGVWLVNFLERTSPRLISQRKLRSYVKKDIFPRFHFRVDHVNKRVYLLIYERFSLKKSTLKVGEQGLLDSKVLIDELDLTQYLDNIGINMDATLNNALRFITQYN